MDPLTVMPGRISPLGIEIDAVVVRVPSHVLPVRKGCQRQRRRHPQVRSLIFDTECLLHRLLALLLDKLPRLDRQRPSPLQPTQIIQATIKLYLQLSNNYTTHEISNNSLSPLAPTKLGMIASQGRAYAQKAQGTNGQTVQPLQALRQVSSVPLLRPTRGPNGRRSTSLLCSLIC